MGRRPSVLVARALSTAAETGDNEQAENVIRPLVIKGTEGMVTRFSKCCRPIPGDPVVAIITGGRGIMIHTQNCGNLSENKVPAENYLDVQWEPELDEDFPVEVSVVVNERRGMLATIAATIGDAGSNIENVGIEDGDGVTKTLKFRLTVHNRKHLASIMRRVRSIPDVIRIVRDKG